MQSQSKFEVYIELLSRFCNLASLEGITIFLTFVTTFRSFTWKGGAIFYTLFLHEEKIHQIVNALL